MKISFTTIIPCFNTQDYLKKCLDSLINQNYDLNLMQILIINDGSTNDEVEKISIEYKNKYPMIEYYKKENNNWGSVINYVLENKLAKNDYIHILDSDDFLHKNAFRNINKLNNGQDVLIGSHINVMKKINKYIPIGYIPPFFFLFQRVIKDKERKQSAIVLPLIYFYKKDIFYKSDKLREGEFYQDNIFIYNILKNSESIKYTYKVTGYYYKNRPNNSMSLDWNKAKVNTWYKILLFYLENDCQELISCKLTIKGLKKEIIKMGVKFEIKRDFKFKTLPILFRWAFYLIVKLSQRKLFIMKK